MNAVVRAAARFGEQLGRHEAIIKAVSRVVLGPDGVVISVCRRTAREMLGLVPEACAEGQAELTVPIDLTRTRGVLRFKVAGAEDETTREAPALIGAVVKSRGWIDRILRGDVLSQRDLAAQEGYDERYVSRLLPLAFRRLFSMADSLSVGAWMRCFGRCRWTGLNSDCYSQRAELLQSPGFAS